MSENITPDFMPVHPESRKLQMCPKEIPMKMLNEDQAFRNHSQTLRRLAERGGLSLKEALAVADRKRFEEIQLTEAEALAEWNRRLTAPSKEKEEAAIPEEIAQWINDIVEARKRGGLSYDCYSMAARAMYHKLQEEINQVVENAVAFSKLSVEQANEIAALQSQLSSISFDKENLRTRVDDAEKDNRQLVSKLANAQRERDAALKEVGECKNTLRELYEAFSDDWTSYWNEKVNNLLCKKEEHP